MSGHFFAIALKSDFAFEYWITLTFIVGQVSSDGEIVEGLLLEKYKRTFPLRFRTKYLVKLKIF